MTLAEEWRPWRDGNYEVSSHGRVRRAKPGRRTEVGRLMTPITLKIGYLMVGPTVNGKNVNTFVHAMVAECFIGPRPEGAEINHIDGNKANPHVSNLEYVTHAENMAHAGRTGLMVRGERHGGAKLSDVQTAEIRTRRAAGERGCDLAREYGVSDVTVCNIHKGNRRAS